MKFLKILIVLSVCILTNFLLIESVSAKKSLAWLIPGQIPAYIEEGEYKNQGFIDKAIQLIHENALTDYSPEYIKVNHKRFNVEAKKENNCYFGWKTFAKYRIFSDPITIWFPSGIIVHKRDQNLFGKQGTILSLAELLKNTELKLGVIDSFAYSPEVQEILTGYKDKSHVYFNKSIKMQIDLTMLTTNRFNYTIGWPSQPIVGEKLNNIPNEFLFYNMKEDQNYLYLGVSCGKCETGDLVINRVNKLFQDKKFLFKVMSYIEQWVILSDQYKELHNETILNRKENPQVMHMVYP